MRCGRLFQKRAAATRKARSPTVDNRVRRMTSDDDEAERSWHRASKSASSRSSSARYDGAAPCRHSYRQGERACSQSVCRLQLMKFVKERSEVVVFRRRGHQPGSGVYYRLQMLELVQQNTGKNLHFHNPVVTKQVMLPATGKRIWGRIGGCFIANAVRRSRQRRSSWRVTSQRRQSWYKCLGHGQ